MPSGLGRFRTPPLTPATPRRGTRATWGMGRCRVYSPGSNAEVRPPDEVPDISLPMATIAALRRGTLDVSAHQAQEGRPAWRSHGPPGAAGWRGRARSGRRESGHRAGRGRARPRRGGGPGERVGAGARPDGPRREQAPATGGALGGGGPVDRHHRRGHALRRQARWRPGRHGGQLPSGESRFDPGGRAPGEHAGRRHHRSDPRLPPRRRADRSRPGERPRAHSRAGRRVSVQRRPAATGGGLQGRRHGDVRGVAGRDAGRGGPEQGGRRHPRGRR